MGNILGFRVRKNWGDVAGFFTKIFRDCPVLHIYWKCYGFKMMTIILAIFYAAIFSASLIIEFLFQWFHLIPEKRSAEIVEMSIKFNYTTVLNIIFIIIAAIFLFRFWKTRGPEMLRKMK